MFKTLITASVMTLALAGMAQAAGADGTGQFYATPVQKGAPTDLPGERLIPGASQAAQAVDVVVGPVVPITHQVGTGVGQVVGGVIDPIGAAIGDPTAAPAAAAAPVRARRHHRHARHHMTKRKLRH